MQSKSVFKIINSPPFIVLLLIVASALSFCSASQFEYLNYDDLSFLSVVQVEDFRYLHLFTSYHVFDYIPLTLSSFAFENFLWGLHPEISHTINIVLHTCNAILIFWLTIQLTQNYWAAFFISLLWLIHPVQNESVAWVAERKGLLSTLFSIISLILWSRGRRFLSFILLILAILSKPSAVVVPFIWPIISWLKGLKLKPTDWSFLFFGFLLSISFSLFHIIARNVSLAIQTKSIGSPISIPDIVTRFEYYIATMFWPLTLSPFSTRQFLITHQSTLNKAYLVGIILIGTGLVLSFFYNKINAKKATLSLFAAALILIPHLKILPFGLDFEVSNKYLYFSYYWVLLAVYFAVSAVTSLRKTTAVVSVVVSLLLFNLQQKNIVIFKNSDTFWGQVIFYEPCLSLAHNNRGLYFFDNKEYSLSIPHFQKSIACDPTFAKPYLNLGAAYYRLKSDELAKSFWEKALEIFPDYEAAKRNLELLIKDSE